MEYGEVKVIMQSKLQDTKRVLESIPASVRTNSHLNGEVETFTEIIRLLDLAEQGRLVELPCVIGDTVFDVALRDDGRYKVLKMRVANMCPSGTANNGELWNLYLEDDYTYAYKTFCDVGRTVFINREAAEARLAELEETK